MLSATTLFLGPKLVVWLLLALGAAMVAGNVLALVRPPPRPRHGELQRAPVGRSVVMITIGLLAGVWAVASLAAR